MKKPVKKDRFAPLGEVLEVVVVLPLKSQYQDAPNMGAVRWRGEKHRLLTLDWASDIAATITPTVSIATEIICHRLYRFPHTKPTNIVVTLPPLRRIMWTGMEMLYPNTRLLRRLTVKKRKIFGSQRVSGIALGLRKKGGCEAEKWLGHVKRAVTTN